MNPTPTVSPWLWASVFAQTLAAGLNPLQVARQQRDARLAQVLRVALDSPLYRQRLGRARSSGPDALQALEPVDKPELMQRFDDWATDRAVTRHAVQRFLEDRQLADAFLGRYLVWTSSGTSGEPGIFVQDECCLAAYEALDALRLRGPAADALPLPAWSAGQRFAFIAATGGPFAGAVAIERLQRLRRMPTPWTWATPS
ncbi:MAG TPA: phenylacetate--CoA ligase family protein, partial [Burkholderiaceae bacterium]|nr:phenylacetate--CoA ligase family protein [Burkholderiaceae bacterium]